MKSSHSESSSTTAQGSSANIEMSTRLQMDAISVISDDMKTLVKKIRDLRHLGIEDQQIALPKICVIGDQSTGKSSLIEGMSEIKVPRSSGTCTRCPMEINLSSESDQPWSCRVYLSKKYQYDGNHRVMPKRSKPLGPWIAQNQEDQLFTVLSDKDRIQEAIMRAQLATLNPGRDPCDFLEQQIPMSTDYEVKFSPNVVRLDITAPDFPNLSFYDLPGVISQAEVDEERYLVTLVENLVKDYISRDNCIVLLALPMTDDATNSSAARIMRDVQGAKKRTLGVLTKPDRIQSGESYAQWIEILEGDKFSLGHGYYVVRNNHDPAISHLQARIEEDAFFKTSPWTAEFSAYESRFGTRQLQTALSNLLLEQIQGCLPHITKQINDKAFRIESELKTLPDPPTENFPYILCKCLNDLKDRMRAHFDGGSSEYPLQKIWGRMALDFKTALIKTRPTVQLLADADFAMSALEDGQDSDCEMTAVQPLIKRAPPESDDRQRQTPVTPDNRRMATVAPDTRPSDKQRQTPTHPDDRSRATPRPKPSVFYTHHFEEFTKPTRVFTWAKIREINEDSYRAGIADQADPKAIEIMRKLSVEHWDSPMTKFIKATHTLVREMLAKQLKDVFKDYQQTRLYRELGKIVDQYLSNLQKDHFEHAFEIYNIEHKKPFTMAIGPLEEATKKAQEYLSSRRLDARVRQYMNLHSKFQPGEPRWEAEMKKLIASGVGPDRYTQELKMMASTRGYYDVANSRFIDSICQSVYTKLFSKCREELISVIEEQLGVCYTNASDRCRDLMAEDPERQRRREYLIREKKKVNQAQEWLSTVKKEDDGISDEQSMFVSMQSNV